MRRQEFEALSLSGQVDALYQAGVYVGKSCGEGFIKVLYQIESFYVEVAYKKYRSSIRAIRCFDSTGELDAYIEHIDIEPLVYP